MNTVTKSVQYVESSVEPEEWERLGLPGVPVVGDNLIVPRLILRDHNGKPALCLRAPVNTAHALADRFDFRFDLVHFIDDPEAFAAFKAKGVPVDGAFQPDCIGFAPSDGRVLSIPDRVAAATIVGVFNQFMVATPRSYLYALPAIFESLERETLSCPKAIPHRALTEEKAYQVAAVAGHILKTPVDVVQDEGGYFAVAPHCKAMEGMDALLRLSNAVDLLAYFDVAPCGHTLDLEKATPVGMQISRFVGERYTQQQRIESKLDQILAAAAVGKSSGDVAMQTLLADVKAKPKAPGKSVPKSSKRSA